MDSSGPGLRDHFKFSVYRNTCLGAIIPPNSTDHSLPDVGQKVKLLSCVA